MSYQFTEDPRDYLKREMDTRFKRRPSYSLRAFARDMDVAPSTLVDFFKKRSGFSKERIHQLSQKLHLSSEQKSHWTDLMVVHFSKNENAKQIAKLKIKNRIESEKNSLTTDQFKVISDWYHFAFLELLNMNSAKYSDLQVAANDLGIPLKTIKIAVKRLSKLKHIQQLESGRWISTPNSFTGDTTPSEAIRNYHYELMGKAQKALETQNMQERHNATVMVSLSAEQIPLIMDQLKKWPVDFLTSHTQATQNPDQLYALGLQFFSLLDKPSKISQEKK